MWIWKMCQKVKLFNVICFVPSKCFINFGYWEGHLLNYEIRHSGKSIKFKTLGAHLCHPPGSSLRGLNAMARRCFNAAAAIAWSPRCCCLVALLRAVLVAYLRACCFLRAVLVACCMPLRGASLFTSFAAAAAPKLLVAIPNEQELEVPTWNCKIRIL
jgi:hypothetical protein